MVRSQPGGQDLTGSSGISGLPDANPGMQRRAAGRIAPECGSLDSDPHLYRREYPPDPLYPPLHQTHFSFSEKHDVSRPFFVPMFLPAAAVNLLSYQERGRQNLFLCLAFGADILYK